MLYKSYDEELNSLVDMYSNSPEAFTCDSDQFDEFDQSSSEPGVIILKYSAPASGDIVINCRN